MNRIDVKELVLEDVTFKLNKTRTLFKLEKIMAEHGITGKLPFLLFIDDEDKASLKYVKYKILDLNGTKIEGIPISFTELHDYNVNIKDTQLYRTLMCIYSKYNTTDIPYIIQIPSDSHRFKMFNHNGTNDKITKILNSATTVDSPLDADFFVNKNTEDIYKKSLERMTGSFQSDSETMDTIISESYIPATPKGILSIINKLIPTLNLKRKSKNFSGLKVAVVGCNSKTTGKYLSEILPALKATVSLYHSKSIIDKDEFKDFDIVISCVGNIGFLTKEIIGTSEFDRILIDVGVSVNSEGKVKGDFHEDVRVHRNHYTPYVNGVGLLTRAALLNNIMLSYYCIFNKNKEVK